MPPEVGVGRMQVNVFNQCVLPTGLFKRCGGDRCFVAAKQGMCNLDTNSSAAGLGLVSGMFLAIILLSLVHLYRQTCAVGFESKLCESF